jgi:glyoxylase-like metal-dependent hydrolase (beta-lactamase superfamily II)
MAQERKLGPNRLVLLGTRGGPRITGYAPSPAANLIVWDNVPYVVDTGYGATFKLVEAKFPLPALRYTFITHHHSDHNAEFGLLVYNAWASGLHTPIDAYGPAGMAALAQGFWDAYKFDIDTRIVDEGRPDLRKLVKVHEYAEGPVMAAGDVKVTALRNVHPPIAQSFALKFEFPGKTIVFSGDTATAARGLCARRRHPGARGHVRACAGGTRSPRAQRRDPDGASEGQPHLDRRGRPHRLAGRREEARAQPPRAGRCPRNERADMDRRRAPDLRRRTGGGPRSHGNPAVTHALAPPASTSP